MPLRTGLVSITFRQLSPAEIIGLVKQTRLASIEFVRQDSPQAFLADAGTLASWLDDTDI